MTTSGISRSDWEVKLSAARAAMAARAQVPGALIEVSTQHPLVDGKFPGPEFVSRLETGLSLYRRFREGGTEAHIVACGSRHRQGDHTDAVSLTEAGAEYLRAQGVPDDHLPGPAAIERYKGAGHRWPGVYTSADEAYVAANLWRDGGYGRLVSVVSPAQLHRKMLHYIWNGVLPLMVTCPVAIGHHDPVHELYKNLPYTRDVDPDWQGGDSEAARGAREERRVD